MLVLRNCQCHQQFWNRAEQVRNKPPRLSSRVAGEGKHCAEFDGPRCQSSRLLTKFVEPWRHHAPIQFIPVSVPRTRRGLENSALEEVVCSLLPVRATAGQSERNCAKDRGDVSGGGMDSRRIKNKDDNMDMVVGAVCADGRRRLLEAKIRASRTVFGEQWQHRTMRHQWQRVRFEV